MKRVVVLGSTGTIGTSTLAVIRNDPGAFRVAGIACRSDVTALARQIAEFRPRFVHTEEPSAGLKRLFPRVRFCSGPSGLEDLVADARPDIVVAAVPGIGSLRAVLAAARAGRTVCLATKEIMVVAGAALMRAARTGSGTILPVDSEHNAIFQILVNESPPNVRRIILTASGGPFLRRRDVSAVTVDDVLAHPVWKMGRKVTVDSATLMNKGFEVIEAHHLFGLGADRIDVLVHPEAIVHGLVELTDGVVKAVLSPPDMKFAINAALHHPGRAAHPWGTVDFARCGRFTFEGPSGNLLWLELAREAIRQGGSFPIVLDGANEEAVSLFLARRLAFDRILPSVEAVLRRHRPVRTAGVGDIAEIHAWSREMLRECAGHRQAARGRKKAGRS